MHKHNSLMAANGMTSVVQFPMMFLSGTFFALEAMPDWLQSIARGELGFSVAYNSPVGPLLWPRARNTLLLTVPNQLGVDYNAHVIESVLKFVAPDLGWR